MSVALGQMVHYVSRTGSYELPAVVSATQATLNPAGVELGHIAALTGEDAVHLTVFSPGQSGLRAQAMDFAVDMPHPPQENFGGTYTEWDIAQDSHGTPGTWHDQLLCPFGVRGGLPGKKKKNAGWDS